MYLFQPILAYDFNLGQWNIVRSVILTNAQPSGMAVLVVRLMVRVVVRVVVRGDSELRILRVGDGVPLG